jgi:hypothetical protein
MRSGTIVSLLRREVLIALKKKLNVTTDRNLADKLGVKQQSLWYWRHDKAVTPRQIANLVDSSRRIARKDAHTSTLRPIVEFFKISTQQSGKSGKPKLFATEDDMGTPHPYYLGLQAELKNGRGIYLFFDSRGRAIYAGKARRQSLWTEMTLAFNRDRGAVQKIRRTKHPQNKVLYRTSEEKLRQIKERQVPLYELASYFSAYHVDDEMIDPLEALLVRSFANDLLNVRMEKFSRPSDRVRKNQV